MCGDDCLCIFMVYFATVCCTNVCTIGVIAKRILLQVVEQRIICWYGLLDFRHSRLRLPGRIVVRGSTSAVVA